MRLQRVEALEVEERFEARKATPNSRSFSTACVKALTMTSARNAAWSSRDATRAITASSRE